MKLAFDNEKFLSLQKEKILERINKFNGKLYLEFGGKLFDDHHAARVLPGFEPDSKIKMLLGFKDDCEVIICVNSHDVESNKLRTDYNITYSDEAERLIDLFTEVGLKVSGVVLSFYYENESINKFEQRLINNNIKVYHHYAIQGYPEDIKVVCSLDGLGKNDYIETTKPLVIVTAPGPGSGKMATCISQIYNDHEKGILSGYAKYETFPVWNLPVNSPVNIAYEAATVDLKDLIMIDPFHYEEYGILTTNYNRDIETFPLLKSMFEMIYSESPYKSPTDMGVNMIGYSICNEDVANESAKAEIIRRYYQIQLSIFNGQYNNDTLTKIQLLMNKVGVTPQDRKCVMPCLEKAQLEHVPVMSLELEDGTIITGKQSPLLKASSALLLNALKHLAKIDDSIPLISKNVIDPMIKIKMEALGNKNPRLHISEILIALALQAPTNPLSELAIAQIKKLNGAQAHSSVILDQADLSNLKKMGIMVTEEPVAYSHHLFNK